MTVEASAAHPAASKAPEGPALIAAVVVSFLIGAGLLVYGSGRGFDLTDEVFYLVWTRDPRAYALTYQPFGYLLHPLFRLAGEDLQAYRLAGMAIVATAGAFVGQGLADLRGGSRTLALYGAAAALTIFYPWIVTPSYNSAANVGALLVMGGVLQALRPTRPSAVLGALATGAGLCAAAFAKPPLFAIAAVMLALVGLLAPKARLSLIAGLATSAILISLLAPPPELIALVGRILATQHILGMPNTILGLPAKVARDWLAVPLVLSLAAIAAALSAALPASRASRAFGYAAMALSLGYGWQAAIDLMDGDTPDFLGLALITAVAGYAGAKPRPSARERLILAAILFAPVAIALGTFNNQWGQLNLSMAFPWLALFFLAASDPAPMRRAAVQAFAVIGPVAVLLLAAARPYSLPASIFEQQIPASTPLARGQVRVDPETAEFVRGAHGLARGAVLVDLSGTGPGVGAVLGARSPVLPWLNPATPTWPDVVWSRMSAEDRQRAWFVAPPWPGLAKSQPALWLAAHRDRFCSQPLPQMAFWGEERSLELLRPCAAPGEPNQRSSPPSAPLRR